MGNNIENNFIDNYPRECLVGLYLIVLCVWQTIACILAIVAYLVFSKKYVLSKWIITSLGFVLLLFGIYLSQGDVSQFAVANFIKTGFTYNKLLWLNLITGDYKIAFMIFYNELLIHSLALPFFLTGLLEFMGFMQRSPHEETLKGLQEGVMTQDRKELPEEKVKGLLERISDSEHAGTLLGISKHTGAELIIPDYHLNQVAMVLGTTGSGKTITLRRFYQRAINKGYPLIIVDAKPDNSNIEWVKNLAGKNGRTFYGFNCSNHNHYDPLSEGGYTELKDKIISLKHEWSSDYYRSIAEDYLQTTIEVLLKKREPIDLKKIVKCLNFIDLQDQVRSTKDEALIDRVKNLEQYKRDDITGLQAHLNLLVNSELGEYFKNDSSTFKLRDVIDQCGVVYFALPALRFPSFSKVLGKLVINDLKAVVDRYENSDKRIFTVFDEFSVFAGEQVLNLVNMGRGKGVHAIFGTQGLADLEKVDTTFKKQLLNCVNTLICHRLNEKESAEDVANWVGTQDRFNLTAQLNLKEKDASLGSVRVNKQFIIHPDYIKQELKTGEAFYVSKVKKFEHDKIKVKYL